MKTIIHFVIVVCCLGMLRPIQGQELSNITKQKPFRFDGNLELRGMFYHASGIADRMEPVNYLISGSPTISLYGWSIPFSFTLSKKQSSFQQPFNQFGLSPTYKWITLHAGYRNITFSPYTLAGHTILGGGVELNPGKLRFGLMYGRLNRATVIDTASMSLVPYSFTRKGLAVKLGYGTNANFFDLNLLHAKDDSSSIAGIVNNTNRKVTPAANSVLGYGTRFTIFKQLYIESDGAVSLLTRDINSTLSLDSITDKTLRKLGKMLDINGTSEWFLAFNAGIGYQAKNYGVKVNYRRVEPGFTSMGAYYFTNDVENLTIMPNYSHPSGRFRFNGSLGIEQDNVRLQKEATSKRVIGTAMLTAELTKQLGIDLNFSNFSNNQKPNTLRFADSLKIVQTTRTFGIMPRFTLSSPTRVQMILLSVNFNSMNDYNSYFDANNAPSRDINSSQYLLNYTLSLPQEKLSFNSSLSYTMLKSSGNRNSYKGISGGATYLIANNKLSTGTNLSYMRGNSNGNKSGIFNGSLNLSYTISKLQSIRAMVYFTNNNPGSVVTGVNPSFSETRGEIAYQLNFGL
ncbi:hypothetical protein [Sphingobacterium sp. DR205]|uniref:hypothetical protein n=1 Tax=Sphingobacterium sp. DR205 TaxID=2713573 RepID=UPI0013E43D09|nr:hypothetical protein [Sphingobacterium sp. DR205]QIH34055.1 hypothetical protein G6053_14695 [Sphingobacterium sp. DR205]